MKKLVHARRTLVRAAVASALAAVALPALATAGEGAQVPIAHTESFGQGCGDRALRTAANSRPHVGNSNFAVVVTGAEPRDAVVLVLGTSNTEWRGGRLPLDLGALGHGGCQLLVSIDSVTMTTADGGPYVGFALPIPDEKEFLGLQLYAQSFAVGPYDGAFAASNGLDILVGA
ncbi:MAG: hypothetical protein R3F34_20895 [Planctomycetota bacterium]